MRVGLSEISTVGASFADDVAAYAGAGFDAIGLWEFKLPEDDAASVDVLRRHGLAVANCVPAVPSLLQLGIPGMEGPADPEERIEALCASVRRLAVFEPECVLCLTGPLGDRTEAEARAIVVEGLRHIGAAARESGVRLGFEPTHPAERDTTGFVHTAADAAALLDEAGLADAGVVVDTFNLWEDDGAVTWLRANVSRVAGVHVADVPADGSAGRGLPGTNSGRTPELVEALRAGGWDGTLDVEIFSTSDGFWALSVDEAARRAYGAARRLVI
ncbi:MAG: sugar phosphate isomerase/epimerase family protein [Gaiellaceae bacterium]